MTVHKAFPDFYTGARQYEGENFDMKNIEENVINGCRSDVTNFQDIQEFILAKRKTFSES